MNPETTASAGATGTSLSSHRHHHLRALILSIEADGDKVTSLVTLSA